MKYFFFLLTAAFISCNMGKNLNDKSLHLKASPTVSWETKKILQDTLFRWYLKNYQQDIAFYGGSRLNIDSIKGDTSLLIDGYDFNEENMGEHETIIPACKDFIEGDLNNDGFNDLIISVYYNQGSRPRLTNFCYITKNNELTFYKTFSIHELGICSHVNDTSGRFFPAKIENGRLVGQTDCLQKGDPGCCPSLEYITYYTFDNGFKFEKNVIKDSSRVRH